MELLVFMDSIFITLGRKLTLLQEPGMRTELSSTRCSLLTPSVIFCYLPFSGVGTAKVSSN